jgi:hypothetical protein
MVAPDDCPPMTTDVLKQRLSEVKTGRENDAAYRDCVLAILEYLFHPDLSDARTESASIVLRNRSEKSFWAFLRWEHSSDVLTFVTVNNADFDETSLDEASAGLGDGRGSLAMIVTRSAPVFEHLLKTYSMFRDRVPRKALLIISDIDLKAMIDLKTSGRDPAGYVQTIYRGFRDSVR